MNTIIIIKIGRIMGNIKYEVDKLFKFEIYQHKKKKKKKKEEEEDEEEEEEEEENNNAIQFFIYLRAYKTAQSSIVK
jgi:hypothetical protein